MREKKVPEALFEGTLEIGEAKIPCAVLEDGTRVLTQAGMQQALGRSRRPSGKSLAVDQLPPFLAAQYLEPFIDDDLRRSTSPVVFKPLKGGGRGGNRAYGYVAELLPKVCEVILQARDAGVLHPHQARFAIQADILMRGLAHVGIIALVDEATGFQEVRDRIALQKILEKYVTGEWSKWTKTFPDEFYIQLFRLKGVPYPPIESHKNWRPSYVGHWTNDIVYSRLAPGVLKELNRVNPRTDKGYRKRKQFQHMTPDYGTPALRAHLSNVIFLMRACRDWDDFKRRLETAAPRPGDTIPLALED
jgi:hypothetical protein